MAGDRVPGTAERGRSEEQGRKQGPCRPQGGILRGDPYQAGACVTLYSSTSSFAPSCVLLPSWRLVSKKHLEPQTVSQFCLYTKPACSTFFHSSLIQIILLSHCILNSSLPFRHSSFAFFQDFIIFHLCCYLLPSPIPQSCLTPLSTCPHKMQN